MRRTIMRDVSAEGGGAAVGAVAETEGKPLLEIRGRHRATARPAVAGAIEELSALVRSGPVVDLLLRGGRDADLVDRLVVLSAAAAAEKAAVERDLGNRRAWLARVLAELGALRREVRAVIAMEESRLRTADEELDRAGALRTRLTAAPEPLGAAPRLGPVVTADEGGD